MSSDYNLNSGVDPHYLLNCIPIRFKRNQSIDVGVLPFESKEQLQELRDNYEHNLYFKRIKNEIYSVSLVENINPIGDVKKIKLGSYPSLVANLALHSLKNHLSIHKNTVYDFKPVIFCNDLQKPIYENEIILSRLSYNLDTRFISPNGDLLILLTCNINLFHLFKVSCYYLISKGIDLTNRYVCFRENQSNKHKNKRKLLGKIKAAIDNNTLLVSCKDEDISINSNDLYLEPRVENIKYCLSLLNLTAQSTLLEEKIAEISHGSYKLEKINKFLNWARCQGNYRLCSNVEFGFGDIVEEGKIVFNRNFERTQPFSKPILIFDPSYTRVNKWNEYGLDQHGPFDRAMFTPKSPNIVVICNSTKKGSVEKFINKLLHGLPSVYVGKNKSRAPYGKGLIRRFYLDKPVIKFFDVIDNSIESYENAAKQAISHSAEHGIKWNLAIIQIMGGFDELPRHNNPYLITKSLLLKQHIPVQEINFETMQVDDSQLVYILNNFSLACYAKMGGIPWLLEANRTIAHELVIGIGSRIISEHRLGLQQRVVGITSVFLGDGNYILSNLSSTVPFEEYISELCNTLRTTLKNVSTQFQWSLTDPIRIIFHVFKPLRAVDEIQAIKKTVNEMGFKNIEYAFLTFSGDHPFLLFDTNYIGNYKGVGKFSPVRGTYFKLSPYELMLVFTGNKELKKIQDGMPSPIIIKLHKESNFLDLAYLSNQAFNFSCHSWRSLSPSALPVTILYSQLIAGLLAQLNHIPSWDPDSMLGFIGRTRWFL